LWIRVQPLPNYLPKLLSIALCIALFLLYCDKIQLYTSAKTGHCWAEWQLILAKGPLNLGKT
jgi:hypothetical protein